MPSLEHLALKLVLRPAILFVTGLDLETLIDKLTYGPRAIMGIGSEGIVAGAPAHLTLLSRIQSLYLMKAIPDHKTTHFG